MDQTAYFAQMREKRKTEILISARKLTFANLICNCYNKTKIQL